MPNAPRLTSPSLSLLAGSLSDKPLFRPVAGTVTPLSLAFFRKSLFYFLADKIALCVKSQMMYHIILAEFHIIKDISVRIPTGFGFIEKTSPEMPADVIRNPIENLFCNHRL